MRRIWIFLLACSSVAVSQPARPLTLPEAITLGREHNRQLAMAAAKSDAASAKAGEAGTGLLPSLTLDGSYHRLSDVPPFEVTVPFYPKPFVISPTVLNSYSTRVTLQQPIFTGFRLRSTARAASYLAEAASLDVKSGQADLDVNVTSAYWVLYLALETEVFSAENVGRLTSYEQDTQNLMRAGLATRSDLLKIQVQLASGQLSLIDARNDARLAMMNLNNIIGLPLETAIEPMSVPDTSAARAPRDSAAAQSVLDSLLLRALSARPDAEASRLRAEAAETSARAARGNWWPQVYLTGSYIYARPNQRYLPTLDAFRGTWDIGIGFQWSLWNWGATLYQQQQADAARLQSTLAFAQEKDDVALDVRRSDLAVHRAMEKLGVARLGLDQADENLRTTTDKFRNGLATSTELLDANVALLQAKTNLTGARVEYQIAWTRFLRALGEDIASH